MKPTRLHYFYANNWPGRIWVVVVPLLCVALMASALGAPPDFSTLGPDAKSYLLLLALAWLLGFFGGGLAGKFILGPMYFHRAQLNGAPYQAGDRVQILVGPHRGRVVRVREAWDWRCTVQVDLGDKPPPGWTDIFSSGEFFDETQVLKVDDAERQGGGDAARPRASL